MNDDASAAGEPLVFVARAVKTRGLKGEIVADLLTDFPERFEGVSELTAVGPAGDHINVELENYWRQKDRIILKLKGYNTIDSARQFVGYDFGLPETERVKLDEGSYYDWEFEGCLVETVQGDELGVVSSIVPTGGVSLLAVKAAAGRELLIPVAESIVIDIDIRKKRIIVDPPDGLLDL